MSRWAETTLAAVAEIGAGNSAPQDKRLFEKGVYPFIRTSDVGQIRFGSISTAADLLNEEGIKGLRLFRKGTILMPKSGASTFLNHRVEMTEDGYVSSHLATVRARTEVCDGKFLLYYLSTVRAQDLIQDHKYPSLTLGAIGEIPVPLPPLAEQRRIVVVLDQAFAAFDLARANAEANIDAAKEIFNSALDATLVIDGKGWGRRKLSALGVIQTGTTPKASDQRSYGNFIPFIKPGDFKPDGSLELNSAGLSKEGSRNARRIAPGSALMVCIGATIGKAAYTDVEITTNQQINSISPFDGVSGEFLYHQFITPTFQRELMKRAAQATLPIINKSKWSDIEVAVPPDLTTQIEAVRKLREVRRHVEALLAASEDRIKELGALRQSLLQAAFSGQLS